MSWTDRGIRTDPLRYVDGCFTVQGKSTNSTASTTAIVISDLAGYGDDFFNDHYYMQIIQADGAAPESEVRQITDYVSATGTFTVTAFSVAVASGDECLILHESLVAIGRDDADNTFASTNVVANRDGSLLERTEFIISMITGGAADLRVSFSESTSVEVGGFLQFTVGLMDIDSGAIPSANIDITTALVQTMEQSRGGGAWAPIIDPVVNFLKADGQVYLSYEAKGTEWQNDDMYRMTLSGIRVTIGTQTAYVPAYVWSNKISDDSTIHTDVKYLYAVADGGTTSPTKVLDNSILSILMTKDSGGDTSDFNNSTDSLEAQSDKLGGFSGDGGAQQDDSVKASLDLAHTDIDNIYIDTQAIAIVVSDIQTNLLPDLSADVSDLQTDLGDPSTRTNLKSIEAMLGNPDTAGETIYAALTTGAGQPQVFTKAITSAANAGDVIIATVTTQPVLVKSLTVHSDGATTADLTSIAISGGAGKVIEFITAVEGAKANIDAQDKQVSWPDLGSGGIYLPTGATIVATLAGTGATAVDLNVVIEYVSTVSGGYLA